MVRQYTTQGVRAQRRTRREVGLENTLTKGDGSEAHSKRDRVRKQITQEVRDQRHTQKEVWLENALLEVVEGSRAHSKGGRVRKHTTQEVRAQRRTRREKKIGLEAHYLHDEDSTAHSKRGDDETPICHG